MIFYRTERPCSHLALTCVLGDQIKGSALSTGVNGVKCNSKMHCVLITRTTFRGGLGHIWPHHICSVNMNMSLGPANQLLIPVLGNRVEMITLHWTSNVQPGLKQQKQKQSLFKASFVVSSAVHL